MKGICLPSPRPSPTLWERDDGFSVLGQESCKSIRFERLGTSLVLQHGTGDGIIAYM
jgi:hypothetical protein